MTGQEFYQDVRALLNDLVAEGWSSTAVVYHPEEIERTALMCRNKLLEILIDQQKPVGHKAKLTICGQIKTVDVVAGDPAPTDLLRLISGYGENDRYTPKEEPDLGEALVATGAELVFIRGGKVYGTALKINYWASPTSEIKDNSQRFLDFPDAFYEVVVLMTVRQLLFKEHKDALDRLQWIEQEIVRAITTLD